METYLGIINVIGFIFYCINILLYKYTHKRKIDTLLTITSFLGGSLGIIIAILLFDRENSKDNMTSRIFAICTFVIQLIVFIMFKSNNGEKITFAIWKLFDKYKILLVYLIIINLTTFTIFSLDKIKAISGKWRYKIVTLLGLCFIGGSIGGLLSMYIFRHKTNVNYFKWGIPMIIVMQIVISIFLVNVLYIKHIGIIIRGYDYIYDFDINNYKTVQ